MAYLGEEHPEPHPLADSFDAPTHGQFGKCICGSFLPPLASWPLGDHSTYECDVCRRRYTDQDDHFMIADPPHDDG